MKVCNRCGNEIGTKDGDNHCPECKRKPMRKVRKQRDAMEEAMRSCGLVKVRGAMGGTYWE